MKVNELVADLRRRAGHTRAEFSERLAVHLRPVQHWERGGDEPTRGYASGAEQIEAMARLAKVTVATDGNEWRVSAASWWRRALTLILR